MTVTVIMPVYNDWAAATAICATLDNVFSGRPDTSARVLMVDDGSTIPCPALRASFPSGSLRGLQSVELLTLRRNLGHQRAIAVGIAHTHRHHPKDAVIVMDSDGEDRPEDVARLLDAFERVDRQRAVFAARRRRVAGLKFKGGYALFRAVHRVLTGRGVRIGNFSVIPPTAVANLVVQSSLWSHYAATVMNGGIPMTTIPIDRGSRLSGESRMDFPRLVAHGLGAVSVFRETVAARVLLGATAVVVTGTAVLVGVLIAPGTIASASSRLAVAGLFAVGISQVVLIALTFTLAMLAGREHFGVLPVRDCEIFVLNHQVMLRLS